MTVISKQFTEIFAPKKIEDMVMLPRIRNIFGNGEVTMHHLLHSGPGTGKSTLARRLAALYEHSLYVNVPREGGVDNLREGGDIHQFCSENMISTEEGKKPGKVLIFDEINHASPAFFEALKGFMDSYQHVKVIGTTNHIEKIPEAIRSRFHCIDFDPQDTTEEQYLFSEYGKRLKIIAKYTKLEFESDAVVAHMLKCDFPDFRSLYQRLQEFMLSGVKTITMANVTVRTYEFKELFDLILKGRVNEPEAIHTLLSADYNNKPLEVISACGDPFIEYIKTQSRAHVSLIPMALNKSVEYAYKAIHIKDQAMAMKACVFELMQGAARINAPA